MGSEFGALKHSVGEGDQTLEAELPFYSAPSDLPHSISRYRLTIDGLLPHPIQLSLKDIKSLGKKAVVASLMVWHFP